MRQAVYFATLFEAVFIFFQKPYKQESADAFVAICKRMIFYNKVWKVCSLFFNARI